MHILVQNGQLENIPAKHIPIAEKGYVLLVDDFFRMLSSRKHKGSPKNSLW
jgi:hypothetical protein